MAKGLQLGSYFPLATSPPFLPSWETGSQHTEGGVREAGSHEPLGCGLHGGSFLRLPRMESRWGLLCVTVLGFLMHVQGKRRLGPEGEPRAVWFPLETPSNAASTTQTARSCQAGSGETGVVQRGQGATSEPGNWTGNRGTRANRIWKQEGFSAFLLCVSDTACPTPCFKLDRV